MHAIGGGYLFKNISIFTVPESITNPLKIYSVFHAVSESNTLAL